ALALRSTLTSAVAKPCIAHMPLPVGTNDMGACREFVDQLHTWYGRSQLFELLDFDSGFCSLENANHVNELGYGYIFALKDNQPELLAEAKRGLLPWAQQATFEAETPWELRNGNWIRRRLYRSTEMAGWPTTVGTWDHLRQVWLVRQETRSPQGKIEIEDRFFIVRERVRLPRFEIERSESLT
ncbi:MAG: hypothetical protein HY731_14955, partial [Candidatus Tectomicrobia bacterium]|nr:hypothetical protein [Candidatus Tectomicrobia bacterium]